MEDIVGGFRKVIQDLLVPELKAVQVELKHHSEQFEKIDKRFEAIDKRFEAIDKRFEVLQLQIDERFKTMQEQMDRRFTVMQEQMDKRFTVIDRRFEIMQEDVHDIKINLQKVIGMLDVDTKITRFEGQIKNIEHMFLEHVGFERKAQAVAV